MSNPAPAWMICPTCGTSWPDATDVCPADGDTLVRTKSAVPVVDDEPLPAGTMVGEYKIESLLGAGGMGEVYAARHPMIGKQVAVKVMNRACSANPINVDRFVQEAKAVNAIGHANIVDIFSFGKTRDGRCFFVMEKLRGESLRARMDKAPMPLAAICNVLEPVLRALEAAHSAAIIHRDLKPDNIFLVAPKDGEPERVKLLDFGIAKLSTTEQQNRPNKTDTGTVIGTPSYMAPEQAAGNAVEAASDIYSIGVVAFEMATGVLPFVADSTVQIMAKHVCDDPPVPSSLRPLPPEVDRLLLAMLQKRPIDRPKPDEVRAQLAAIRDLEQLTMGAVTAPVRAVPLVVTPRPVTADVTVRAKPTPAAQPTVGDHTSEVAETFSATTPHTIEPRTIATPSSPRPRVALPAATGVSAPERSRRSLWIVIAALVVGGGGVLAWQLATSPTSAALDKPTPVVVLPDVKPAPKSQPADPPMAKPRDSTLALDVKPPDAKVAIAGVPGRLTKGHLERTLAPGAYTIVASRAGYETETREVTVRDGAVAQVTIALRPRAATVKPALPVHVDLPGVKLGTGSGKPIDHDIDAAHDPFAPVKP